MPLTLSDVLRGAYAGLGQLNVALATGGSTTTIIDTTQTDGDDDAWKDGAAFVIRDAGGASAAPEGQFNRVSAYVASTGTLTVDTAFSAAVGAGDTYGLVSSYYPLRQMIQLTNDALRLLGDVDLVDTTTLDTVAGDTEYAAAVTWKRSRPYRVDIQSLTGDSSDNQWRNWSDFEYVPAVAGTAGKIIFSDYPVGARDVRVWYKAPHPAVALYSDVIAEVFDPEMVVQAVVAKALEWNNTRSAGADQFLLQRQAEAKQELYNRMVSHPRERVKRKNRLFIIKRRSDWNDDTPAAPDPA